MNISLQLLQTFLPLTQGADELAETLTNLGLAVDGFRTYENIPGGLTGVVVGKVIECQRHPNADRLSVTKVDLGTADLYQIVCGAPNVAAGQTVLVATIGTKLKTSKGDVLEIKKSKIRGELSEGMICAADELGLSEDHSGILLLDDQYVPGTPASDIFPVYRDTIFEIDLTPNRSDATSHYGVAKDLAAYQMIHQDSEVKFVPWNNGELKGIKNESPVKVIVEDTHGCPRYSGISISKVQIKESPGWLKERLKAIGVRPISNVVDITNWILHMYGQPLHAFDLNKINEHTIRVKRLPAGTKFITLDGIERNLHTDDLMICDGDSKPLCIAGVFGGLSSGISDSTTDIFLESAHFAASSVRRTSMRHTLRTDAATRFEKGTDPNITVKSLTVAAQMIIEMAGGYLSSDIVDVYDQPVLPVQVILNLDKVRAVIGQNIEDERIKKILTALDMPVLEETANEVTVEVPTNKSDVRRDIDVIEEILRIHGFNAVPMPEKMEVSFVNSSEASKKLTFKEDISSHLSSLGFNEIMGLSLMESRVVGGSDYPATDLVYISNTSNINLDVMRPDMLRSGLQSIQFNQNRQQGALKFFEFGSTYRSEREEPWPFSESPELAVFIYGQLEKEHWAIKSEKQGYYFLKGILEQLLGKWQIISPESMETNSPDFEYGVDLSVNGQLLIQYGKIKESLAKYFDLRADLYFARIYWVEVFKIQSSLSVNTIRIPGKYPSVRRDLAIVVDKSITWDQVNRTLNAQKISYLQSFELFDVFENEERIGKAKKSLAISLIFENPNQTLKEVDLDLSMEQINQRLKEKLGAVVR